jgi:putative FmdB family regulatory protein
MPTYEYTCRDCGHTFDIVQSMWDESLTMCPECGGSLRKVFAPPAISFKGSGFYATDHGKNSKNASESRNESKGEGEKKSEGQKSETSEGRGSGDQKSDGKKSGDGSKSTGSKESSAGGSPEGRSTPAKKEPAPS